MFFNSAKEGNNNWMIYLGSPIVILICYSLFQLPLNYCIGSEHLSEFHADPNFSNYGINKNLGFALMLLMFVGATLGLLIWIKLVHKKKIKTFIRYNSDINFSKISFGFLVWILLSLIVELINYYFYPELYVCKFDLRHFLMLLIISFFLLPIQTTFEELFFRSYLLQAIGILTNYKWATILITSILFGLVHISNPEIAAYGIWKMEFYYIYAGLFLAFITVMDNGLELAIGVHWATNFYGALFVGYEKAAIQTYSIFQVKEVNIDYLIFSIIITSIIFILISRYKYSWKGFRKFNRPIFNSQSIL